MSVRFRYNTCLQCGLKFLTSIQLTVILVFDCPLALCRCNVNSSYTEITHITSVRPRVDESISKRSVLYACKDIDAASNSYSTINNPVFALTSVRADRSTSLVGARIPHTTCCNHATHHNRYCCKQLPVGLLCFVLFRCLVLPKLLFAHFR